MTQRKDYKLIYDPFLFKESERAQRGKLPIYRFNGETSRNEKSVIPKDPRPSSTSRNTGRRCLVKRFEPCFFKEDEDTNKFDAILVTGISPLTPETQIWNYFSNFGVIRSVEMKKCPQTGASLGIARIVYSNEEGLQGKLSPAVFAISRSNRRTLGDSVIKTELDYFGLKLKHEFEKKTFPSKMTPSDTESILIGKTEQYMDYRSASKLAMPETEEPFRYRNSSTLIDSYKPSYYDKDSSTRSDYNWRDKPEKASTSESAKPEKEKPPISSAVLSSKEAKIQTLDQAQKILLLGLEVVSFKDIKRKLIGPLVLDLISSGKLENRFKAKTQEPEAQAMNSPKKQNNNIEPMQIDSSETTLKLPDFKKRRECQSSWERSESSKKRLFSDLVDTSNSWTSNKQGHILEDYPEISTSSSRRPVYVQNVFLPDYGFDSDDQVVQPKKQKLKKTNIPAVQPVQLENLFDDQMEVDEAPKPLENPEPVIQPKASEDLKELKEGYEERMSGKYSQKGNNDGLCFLGRNEDNFFERQARHSLLFDLEEESVEADDTEIVNAHNTGCARTEGYYPIPPELKTRYIPYVVNTSSVAAESIGVSSRDYRLHQRQLQSLLSAKLGGTKSNSSSADQDSILKLNQLKSRRKRLKFARSSIHSWGLFAMEMIDAGDMIVEYVGEIIRQKVADKREREYELKGIKGSYLFRIDEDNVIDATFCGNASRFINHSCKPNCNAKVITVDNKPRIVIYAKQTINIGEELTYDYKFPKEQEKIPCLCGADECRGTLN